VLFSNAVISDLINHEFEPAWESVRPAAIVRIDFGNGEVLTRTLNGNIATYVCAADGTVLDIIPGVYDPGTYQRRLEQALLLYRWMLQRTAEGESRPAFLKHYHAEQAAALRQHSEPRVIVEIPEQPLSIVRVESGMKLVLQSALTGLRSARHASTSGAAMISEYELPRDLSSRMGRVTPEMLTDDTRHNESVRRLKVHDYLAANADATPGAMTKWLYREVLNTDLDDPHLGLGKVLFQTYPFADGADELH
jgi:hypothetical protein